ncbi:MAG: LON peptidase substrate-binding domain-containing protein, partial [Pyrinomonadaceae bacterium]
MTKELNDLFEELEDISQASKSQFDIPSEIPVLPLRDLVIYPFMIVPLFVSRERSLKAIDQALSTNRMILLVAQKDAQEENPEQEDLHKFGTIAVVMRKLNLSDGRSRVLVQGILRAKVQSITLRKGFLQAKIIPIPETATTEKSIEVEALIRNVRQLMEQA